MVSGRHDLIPAELQERTVLLVVPVVDEADSPRAREGIARRRLVALTGACPCGAMAIMPNRAQRRAGRRAGDPSVVMVDHKSGCPAVHPHAEDRPR